MMSDKTAKEHRSSGQTLFYLVASLIPVLFFVLLEVVLRIAGYGSNYLQWVSPVKGTYMLNPDIARKYLHTINEIPSSNGDVFDEVKKPGAFRVFVVGSSAAAGYPFQPNGAFSRYIRQRLTLEYPDSEIEVVSCAMSAINSYAIRDLMKGIVKEKPDLIIIYAGNNEYYGALGVGSMESFGTSRWLVNAAIFLEQFRTFQLLRNAAKGPASFFEKKNPPTGTLMSCMARDQYIGLGSKVYKEGVAQFEGNMTDVLEMAKEHNVPVILGTLVCNLKDQYPFVSIDKKGIPRADTVFLQAKKELAQKNFHTADSLFRYAKDLDALRFRAPTAINKVIRSLGGEFNCRVVDIDSAFSALSPDHVVGDNLMTDHLHPTLHGYQIIGRLYYDEMKKTGLLPKTKPLGLTDRQQDSTAVANFAFCRLDSVISDYRIKNLKNDWPYISKKDRVPLCQLFAQTNYIDSLACKVLMGKTDWTTAHKDAALWYDSRGDAASFIRIMDVLTDQFPYLMVNYDFAACLLLKAKDYNGAYSFLTRRSQIQPSAFTEKWLGIVDLTENRAGSAESHLTASLKYDEGDPEVWFNLAEAYISEKDYPRALQSIQMVLRLQPDYPGARALQEQLQINLYSR
jgi:tetratricopeptide (TPR) repeat protein